MRKLYNIFNKSYLVMNQIREEAAAERKKRGLTQFEVSEALDISEGFYATYERGKTNLSREKLFCIIIFFNISIDNILLEISDLEQRQVITDDVYYETFLSYYKTMENCTKEKLLTFIELFLIT